MGNFGNKYIVLIMKIVLFIVLDIKFILRFLYFELNNLLKLFFK